MQKSIVNYFINFKEKNRECVYKILSICSVSKATGTDLVCNLFLARNIKQKINANI